MEILKKFCTPLRSGFTRTAYILEKRFKKFPDIDKIEISMNQLNEKWCALDEKENEIPDLFTSL